MIKIPEKPRIQSIDLLRGIAMVIMALDHVRDYFHNDAYYFSPTDLEHTTATLFFTRFITHFCAPVFCFLAGTSAFFVGQKKDPNSLSVWLLKRGLWLIFLEVTVLHFAWYFKFNTNFVDLSVIWSLGMSMIFLAGLIHLPSTFVIPLGLAIIIGHNMFYSYRPAGDTLLQKLWIVFHVSGEFKISTLTVYSVYPLLPWIGLMALGYYFGKLYQPTFDVALRKKILIGLGVTLIFAFLLFRLTNIYGDLHPWNKQSSPVFTVLAILNVTKYPPSFLFIAVTIGPALIFLAFAEKIKGKFSSMLVTIGQVPLFFYIIHIYLIHIIALFAVTAFGFKFSDMILNVWIGISELSHLKGYGFSLPVVYLIWIMVVAALYPVCKWYNQHKKSNPQQWWLSYL